MGNENVPSQHQWSSSSVPALQTQKGEIKILIVLPFYKGDQDAAVRLSDWMRQLGGCKGHELLLIQDSRAEDLTRNFEGIFDKVSVDPVTFDPWNQWPESCNNMFRQAAKLIEFTRQDKYWLWLEPDVVPISSGWIDKLEAEFKEGIKLGKRFMGAHVQVENVPVHMSGVGIYPSPLSAFGGQTTMAQDIAWDVYGAQWIVPLAHWTDLIVHNWKHDTFKDDSELANLLERHPDMVLFHASKDGSLIHLLRNRMEGDATCSLGNLQDLKILQPTKEPKSSAAPTVQTAGAAPKLLGKDQIEWARNINPRGRGTLIICDIFIKTYPKDYEWLRYCIRSINKFASGFRNIIIVSPDKDPTTVPHIYKPEYCDDWYLSQQIFKVYADTYLDGDYILHIDSDTILTQPVTPETFLKDGKPIWMITPNKDMDKSNPWLSIMRDFMGENQEFEYMRRFPFVFPRWFYKAFRDFIEARHGVSAEDYIKNRPYRSFSEFNCMGAFAYKHHRDKFHWVDTSKDEWPELTVDQRWSHGGMDNELLVSWEKILGAKRGASPNSEAQNVVLGSPLRTGSTTQTFPDTPAVQFTTYGKMLYHASQLAILADTRYHRKRARDALKQVKLI